MSVTNKTNASIKLLKYYVTFRVRKFKSFFYKINTCLQNYHLYWIAGRANILSKYIIYIFFNFGRGFCLRFLSYVFSKRSSFLLEKNFGLIFAALFLYIYEVKKSQIVSNCLKFLKSYFKLEILIYLFFVVSF